MESKCKGLILITGIPASGKTYFSNLLKKKLTNSLICSKIICSDKLEAFITLFPKF